MAITRGILLSLHCVHTVGLGTWNTAVEKNLCAMSLLRSAGERKELVAELCG